MGDLKCYSKKWKLCIFITYCYKIYCCSLWCRCRTTSIHRVMFTQNKIICKSIGLLPLSSASSMVVKRTRRVKESTNKSSANLRCRVDDVEFLFRTQWCNLFQVTYFMVKVIAIWLTAKVKYTITFFVIFVFSFFIGLRILLCRCTAVLVVLMMKLLLLMAQINILPV